MKAAKIIIIFMLIMFGISSLSIAGNSGMRITLPDGTIIPLDGLNSDEVKQMSEFTEKVAKARAKAETNKAMENASQIATDAIANPEKIEVWRKLITGTIKDVCNDLNVTVNEFIKTPVGMGAAGLIVYKVAGKDLLERVLRVILIIPFWFIIMGILFYLRKKYLSTIIVYKEKVETTTPDSKEVVTKYSDPELMLSYPWYDKYNDFQSESRSIFAGVLILIGIIVTIASLYILI
jgi:hypothetical protein